MLLQVNGFMRRVGRQFLLYITIGIVTALVDVATMQFCLYLSNNILFSLSFSYVLAVAFNFTAHAKFTFAFGMSMLTFLKYLFVVLLNYFMTLIFVYLSLSMNAEALIGKLVSLPFVAVLGFVLGKKWVFK